MASRNSIVGFSPVDPKELGAKAVGPGGRTAAHIVLQRDELDRREAAPSEYQAERDGQGDRAKFATR
jgi:hypothetical protein